MTVLLRLARDRRRSFVGWSVGIVVFVLFNNAFYPSFKNTEGFEDIFEDLPEGLQTFFGTNTEILLTSPAGYLQSQMFSLAVPALMIIFSIALGARAIAGSEEEGTLELLLSNPIRREQVLLERFGGVVALTIALGLVMTGSMFLLSWPFELLEGLSLVGLFAACAGAVLLGLLHGVIAFTAGAATGKRSLAVAAAAVAAVGTNLVNAVASASSAAEPLRFISPWHWFLGRNMMAEGIAPDAFLLPVGLIAVLGALSYWTFTRRDLT